MRFECYKTIENGHRGKNRIRQKINIEINIEMFVSNQLTDTYIELSARLNKPI